jgi:hypothetical protein
VGEVRRHAWDSIKNPVGFLKNLAKTFRARTKVTIAPKTAREIKATNYRCPICGSRTLGEGARLVDGKISPCSCASEEYIARERIRGVFPQEKAP